MLYYFLRLIYTVFMTDEIIIDEHEYISSKRASQLSEYTQDYIGQLSRGGQIKARRVGGHWYVSKESLNEYKKSAELYKPEPPIQENANDVESLISFDGKDYMSASRAAKVTGYTQDYVGQLARAGTIIGRQVGNRWFVDRNAILQHKKNKDSLLAAVQAESVGIRRNNESREHFKLDNNEKETFYRYVHEDEDLIPTPLLAQDNVGEISQKDQVSKVPIRILSHGYDSQEEVYRETEKDTVQITSRSRIPGKTIYRALLPVAILMIIAVLSVSFVSLKSASVYTLKATNASSQMVAAVAAATTRIADILEPLLTSEIKFNRGSPAQ